MNRISSFRGVCFATMSLSNRLPMLAGLLGAALVCYFLGFLSGVVIFVVAGLILELSFWVQLFRRKR